MISPQVSALPGCSSTQLCTSPKCSSSPRVFPAGELLFRTSVLTAVILLYKAGGGRGDRARQNRSREINTNVCSATVLHNLTNPVTLEHLPTHLQELQGGVPSLSPGYGEKNWKNSDACPEIPSLGRSQSTDAAGRGTASPAHPQFGWLAPSPPSLQT